MSSSPLIPRNCSLRRLYMKRPDYSHISYIQISLLTSLMSCLTIMNAAAAAGAWTSSSMIHNFRGLVLAAVTIHESTPISFTQRACPRLLEEVESKRRSTDVGSAPTCRRFQRRIRRKERFCQWIPRCARKAKQTVAKGCMLADWATPYVFKEMKKVPPCSRAGSQYTKHAQNCYRWEMRSKAVPEKKGARSKPLSTCFHVPILIAK